MIKQSSLREVDARTTAVVSTDEIIEEINRKGDNNIEFEIDNKSELIDQENKTVELHGVETVAVNERTFIEKEPVTIYLPTRPQGITIQLIEDIQEPAIPMYEGTAVIENIVVDEPAHFKKRTIHTTTNTSDTVQQYESEVTNITAIDLVENVPPENLEQRFVREFQVDVSTTVVDGRPGMVKEAFSINDYEHSEGAAIHFAQEIPVPGDSEPFSKTDTENELEKLNTVNNEESEIISITSGTSSIDQQEDMTMNITPSYLRQIDPSALTITETTTAEQEVSQLNEEPSGSITIDSIETMEARRGLWKLKPSLSMISQQMTQGLSTR